jgi:DNA-binding NtrC family response regulator
LEILENHDLPMNVRQLENALVAALARSDGTDVILPRHLPKTMVSPERKTEARPRHEIRLPADLSYGDAREEALRKVDSIYLPALASEYGSDVQAAKAAGIDRKTFATRLREVRKNLEGGSDEQSL